MEKLDPELNALKDRKAKVLNVAITLDDAGNIADLADANASVEGVAPVEGVESTPEHPDAPQDAALIKDMMGKEEAKEGGEIGNSDEADMQKQAMGEEDPDSVIAQFSKRPAGTLGEKVKLAMAQKMKSGQGKA